MCIRDRVCLTNLNRQIIATRSTVGQYKVDVAAQRLHDIDPDIRVNTPRCFFGPETQDQLDVYKRQVQQMAEQIIEKFVRVYEAGGTPNPGIDCNKYMKFRHLLDWARAHGMEYVLSLIHISPCSRPRRRCRTPPRGNCAVFP